MKAIVVGIASVAAAASVAGAPGPPVIHEPWTPLPCPMHPSATVELQGCVEQAILQSDRTINRKVATIFRLIVRKDDRASFVAGERAWLRYRRLSCTAAGSAFTGGTERPVAELQCERRLNARHITDLTDLERTLRRR